MEFSDSDKLVINGTAEDVAALRVRMEEDRGKPKGRKEKKIGGCLSGSKLADDVNSGILENGRKDRGAKKFMRLFLHPQKNQTLRRPTVADHFPWAGTDLDGIISSFNSKGYSLYHTIWLMCNS
ncbi:hypothetical protein Cni_G05925 [Canna indica]|uniref:Uncharacterized protein n=1 Tax=Canna indica TaxID=4628 RepID=A0AAQ3JY45_9LILI|nr:hypothetical protein Cni_G05925 [Canna indica]